MVAKRVTCVSCYCVQPQVENPFWLCNGGKSQIDNENVDLQIIINMTKIPSSIKPIKRTSTVVVQLSPNRQPYNTFSPGGHSYNSPWLVSICSKLLPQDAFLITNTQRRSLAVSVLIPNTPVPLPFRFQGLEKQILDFPSFHSTRGGYLRAVVLTSEI